MKASVLEDPRGHISGSLDSVALRNIDSNRVFEDAALAVPPHPLGVKPSGNQYTASINSRHCIGIFQILPDEFVQVLLEYLDARLLRELGSTCKALYAFCSSDELWKALFIEYVFISYFSIFVLSLCVAIKLGNI